MGVSALDLGDIYLASWMRLWPISTRYLDLPDSLHASPHYTQEINDARNGSRSVEEVPPRVNYSEVSCRDAIGIITHPVQEIASPGFPTSTAKNDFEKAIDGSIRSLKICSCTTTYSGIYTDRHPVTVHPPNLVCGSGTDSPTTSVSSGRMSPPLSSLHGTIRSQCWNHISSIFSSSSSNPPTIFHDPVLSVEPNTSISDHSSVVQTGPPTSAWAATARNPYASRRDVLDEALNTNTRMCMCGGDTLQGATLIGWLDYLLVNPEGK
jgi:hypothetical protein